MYDSNLRGSSHDTVLVHAVLSYLSYDLASSDPRMAKAFGLKPALAKRIMDLSTSDIMQVAQRGAHCVTIKVDPDAMEGLLASVERQNDDHALMHECIRLEASREMMVELFGLNNRRYAQMRQMNGLPPGNGRSKECSAEDEGRIYEACERHSWDRSPRTLIAIAKELDLPLRYVWDAHKEYGEPQHPTRNVR